MTALVWGVPGNRFYETGVDRGVLYLNDEGVVWNGLISVDEAPSGGTALPYYFDGYKYVNISSAEEYEATLEAYSSPAEFDLCDGTTSIHNGLFITQQPRRSFGLSYRTQIGNDVEGNEHGYKIHLVYNALAAPSNRGNSTLSDSTTPLSLSWKLTTAPPPISGFKPSAHLIVDSRVTAGALMTDLEEILYGTDMETARLPSAQELADLFDDNVPLILTVPGDGSYTAEGYGVNMVPGVGNVNFTIEDDAVELIGSHFFRITT